ncbi:MAG TPA: thioredoxin domain-containing protein, partial [Thiotrichales bacterium]|nr:thioredoxin domain-containing protein [Thiotrichales bacterium]
MPKGQSGRAWNWPCASSLALIMLLRKFPAWPVLLSCLVSMPVLLLAAVEPNTVAAYLQAAKEAGRKPNRLITQSSPYLLQHAYNPVNWYAWGDEAFQRAKKENKPVFLSIGYSTCHWCHVMAHESFENKKIADYLNKHFIAIKVDREERPDIDSVYMAATRLIHGSGGWPMTVFVDHQRRPFHAATYYPPFTTGQHPGLYEVLEKINLLWRRQPARLDAVAASITASIKQQAEVTRDHERVRKDIQQRAMQQIALLYDDEYGGFSAAPKFPTPGIFAYLNKRAGMDDTAAKTASDMMKTTLDAISRGGMYDQLGGGFHRYSVDAMWRLPHFEKMLYSQALMTQAYLGFYSMRPVARYREMVLETLAFVQREMRSPQGGFYAALDADSERIDQTPAQLAEQSPRQSAGQSPEPQAGVETRNKAEGAYYLWTEAQLKKTLTKPEFDFVRDYFETRPAGNIASDPRGEFAHANLLAIAEDYRDRPLKGSEKALLQSAKVKLGTDRLQRPRPHLDDKIITAWNAMMAVSFVQAANLFAEHRSDFIRQAEKTIDFIFVQLYDHRRGRL